MKALSTVYAEEEDVITVNLISLTMVEPAENSISEPLLGVQIQTTLGRGMPCAVQLKRNVLGQNCSAIVLGVLIIDGITANKINQAIIVFGATKIIIANPIFYPSPVRIMDLV